MIKTILLKWNSSFDHNSAYTIVINHDTAISNKEAELFQCISWQIQKPYQENHLCSRTRAINCGVVAPSELGHFDMDGIGMVAPLGSFRKTDLFYKKKKTLEAILYSLMQCCYIFATYFDKIHTPKVISVK